VGIFMVIAMVIVLLLSPLIWHYETLQQRALPACSSSLLGAGDHALS
jgi:hypothetical protein